MRKYICCSNPLERSEFNWFQWQWLKLLSWLGLWPTCEGMKV